MRANILYEQLETDFVRPNMTDEWADRMESVGDFLTENFKKRSIGVVCSNSEEIKKVYTAVFPSDEVMKNLLDKKEQNILLFIHHPMVWDIRRSPWVFQQMNLHLLKKFKENNISIYCLHTPLDNFSDYSTSNSLANQLDIMFEKTFMEYDGAECGVVGSTDIKTVEELNKLFRGAVGHDTRLYRYGAENIKNETVAIVAGGGNSIEVLKEIASLGINTFITGITALNDHSKKVHEFAKEHKINILGGTHYSTEKFACIKMCEYFEKMGIPAEFIEDKPVLEDM